MYLGEEMFDSYHKAIHYEECEAEEEVDSQNDSHEQLEAMGDTAEEVEIPLEKEDIAMLAS